MNCPDKQAIHKVQNSNGFPILIRQPRINLTRQPRHLYREHPFLGALQLIHGPPARFLHQCDLIRRHARQLRRTAFTTRCEEHIMVAHDLAKMLIGPTLLFMHRPNHRRIEAQLFAQFSHRSSAGIFTRLNLPTRRNPEDKQPIRALRSKPYQQHIAALIEEKDPR